MEQSQDFLPAQFFVTRQNGSMVPLIAMDELPPNVMIRGVPHTLTPWQISGMGNVGNFNTRHRQHLVEVSNNGFGVQPNAGDRQIKPLASAHPGPYDQLPGRQPRAYGIEEQAATAGASQLRTSQPSTAAPGVYSSNPTSTPLARWEDVTTLPLGQVPGKKEWCSHWLRKGECDYAQQGCIYRHEMPLTLEGLERVGLRDIPAWYRAEYGIPSLLTHGTSHNMRDKAPSGRDAKGLNSDWRARGPGKAKSGSRDRTSPSHTISTPRARGLSCGRTAPCRGKYQGHSPLSSPDLEQGITPPNSGSKLRSAQQETPEDRQIREALEYMDNLEQNQRGRDLLAEKYPTLQPITKSPRSSSITTGAATPNESESDTAASGAACQIPGSLHTSGAIVVHPNGMTAADGAGSEDSGTAITEIESLLRGETDADLDQPGEPNVYLGTVGPSALPAAPVPPALSSRSQEPREKRCGTRSKGRMNKKRVGGRNGGQSGVAGGNLTGA